MSDLKKIEWLIDSLTNHALDSLEVPEKRERVELTRAALLAEIKETIAAVKPERHRLLESREGKIGRFCFKKGQEDEVKGYILANSYPDGCCGEVFIVLDRAGTTLRGFADAVAINLSMRLQRGETVDEVTDKLIGMRFEPMGVTNNQIVPRATSVLDFTARWLRHYWSPRP